MPLKVLKSSSEHFWGSYAVIRDTVGMKRQVYNVSESIELSHACHMDSQACNHTVESEWFKATTSIMVPTAGHSCSCPQTLKYPFRMYWGSGHETSTNPVQNNMLKATTCL